MTVLEWDEPVTDPAMSYGNRLMTMSDTDLYAEAESWTDGCGSSMNNPREIALANVIFALGERVKKYSDEAIV